MKEICKIQHLLVRRVLFSSSRTHKSNITINYFPTSLENFCAKIFLKELFSTPIATYLKQFPNAVKTIVEGIQKFYVPAPKQALLEIILKLREFVVDMERTNLCERAENIMNKRVTSCMDKNVTVINVSITWDFWTNKYPIVCRIISTF